MIELVDIVGMLRPVTKWTTSVGQADLIPEVVRKAFRLAQLEKPGPTHIELPENVAAARVGDAAALAPIPPNSPAFPEPTDEAIAHAAGLIAAAERPQIGRAHV